MKRSQEDGLTILELIIVIAIVGLVGTLGSIQLIGYFGKAKTDTAKLQIDRLALALDLYRLDTQSYPSKLDDLVLKPEAAHGWNGPYLKDKSLLSDPWGRPYLYQNPGMHGSYDLSSYGSDNKEGGEGEASDVKSWE